MLAAVIKQIADAWTRRTNHSETMKDTLTADAQIENVETLEQAAALVLHYETELAHVQFEEEETVKAVREQLASKHASQISGQTITERLATLKTSISRFVEEHPGDVFPDGTKTRKFAGSEVSMRDGKESVVFAEDADRKKIVEKLIKKTNIGDAIGRLLRRLALQHWLRFKIELDLDAIKKAAKNGKIKPGKLRSLGISIERPTSVNVKART